MEGKKRHSHTGHVTTLVVLLIVVCVTLTVLVVIFATRGPIGTVCVKEGHPAYDSDQRKVCLSPECVEVAALYLANMDLTVDPCEDFFTYTCGGFVKKNPLGEKDLIKDLGLNNIPMATDSKLIKLLEKPGSDLYGKPSVAISKLKILYTSCRNTSANQRNGPETLQQHIDNLGGWSFSGGNSQNPVDLETMASLVHRSYVDGLFKPWIVSNPFKNNHYQIRFQPSAVTYPSNAFYKSKSRSRRRLAAFMTSVISLLGGDTGSPSTLNRIEELIDVEMALTEATPPDSYRKSPLQTNNPMTLAELQDMIGTRLVRYLSLVLGKPVTSDLVVLVESPEYMVALRDVFDNYTAVALADHLIWTWLHSNIMYLSEPFTKVFEAFTRREVNYESDSCLQMTKKYFNQALGAQYLEEHYDRRSDAEVSDMMERLKLAFKENIPYVEWMEEVTKEKTREKVDLMKQVVAHLNLHADAESLDRNYEDVGEVSSDDFFGNIDTLKRTFFAHKLSLLGKKETIERAVSELQAPYDTGATYALHQNTILVWAGLMQYAFYDRRLPAAAKFGSLGFVVGHEVIHAFDNNGKNYDKDGNFIQWWDNKTLSRFDERTQCYVDQYSLYTVTPNRHINGNITLGENIADNGAVKVAYFAYQNWLKKHGGYELEAHLPGLNLTAEQLFFVAMATPLCTVEAEILSIYNINNDVHSQAQYRVIGSLSNFDRFAEAYHCPTGSRMNPSHKCTVW